MRLLRDRFPSVISGQPTLRCLAWALAAAIAALAASAPAEASSKRKHTKSAIKSKSTRKGSASAVRKSSTTEASEAALTSGKIAVFPFEGEDTYAVRKHVIKALADRGLKVDATLRSPDTAEQFRDMGAALDLAVYIHGRVKETGADHAMATVTVRSGVTGRKLTTATFRGFQRGLPYDVEEQLWERVGPAVTRACVEATRTVRRHNAPMRIEAGTPL
jgi:hypothetical protein